MEKKSCTDSAEEIKIVHSGTKQRNLLQASEIKFIQSFTSGKNFLQKKLPNPPPLPPPAQKYNRREKGREWGN